MQNNLPVGAQEFAKSLAVAAGEMMRGHYRMVHTVERKQDLTPVTEADMAVNAMVIAEVQQAFPDHGVLGEEASYNQTAEWLWVCDPIDGTYAYMTRVPTSAFSLALVHQGEVLLAIVYTPFTSDMYMAEKGKGAWLGDRRLQVSTRGVEGPAFVCGSGSTTSPHLFIDLPVGIAELQRRGWHTVNFSGIASAGAIIADGAIDGVFYRAPYAHDIAAIALLVTEAGGKVTDIDGQPQRYDGPINGAIVSNGIIHDDLVAIAATIRAQE